MSTASKHNTRSKRSSQQTEIQPPAITALQELPEPTIRLKRKSKPLTQLTDPKRAKPALAERPRTRSYLRKNLQADENQAQIVDPMDTDEGKSMRSSAPMAIKKRSKSSSTAPADQTGTEQGPDVIKGKKSESSENNNPSGDEVGLTADQLFGEMDVDDGEDNADVGGLFGEDEPVDKKRKAAETSQRLAELAMNIGSPTNFNPNAASNNQWKSYLADLTSDDMIEQFQALISLGDALCVMTEDTSQGFKLDSFLPPLVNILNTGEQIDAVLMSCRCMSHILEALPGSENAFIRNEAIPGLVEKLMNYEYDDLREQAMNVIGRLCENPIAASHVLKNGGLVSILANLDFSALSTQVRAVTTASNMLRVVSLEYWPQIKDAMPTLAMLLTYEDTRLVEKSAQSIASIATHFQGDSIKLEELCNSGALSNMIRLVTERAELSNINWVAIRTLATLCRGLPSIIETLIATGIPTVLKNLLLLERDNATKGIKGIRQSAKTNTQAVYDMAALCDQLLPPLPAHIAVHLKSTPSPLPTHVVGRRGMLYALAASSGASTSSNMDLDLVTSGGIPIPSNQDSKQSNVPDPRTVYYASNPEALMNVSETLLGTLTLVLSSRVNTQLRSKCLSAIAKIIISCNKNMLTTLLRDLTFSSFLASLLASKELKFISVALSLAEDLMEKLPSIFSVYFMREGVVHEVEKLISVQAQFAPPSNPITPSKTPSTPNTPIAAATPSSFNPDNSILFPLTPNTSGPSFMWEALSSPPDPSNLRQRMEMFAASKSSKSQSQTAPTSTPVSFGNTPHPTKSPVPTPQATSEPSSQNSSSMDSSSSSSASSAPAPAPDPASSAPAPAPDPASVAATAMESLRVEIVDRCTSFKQKHFSDDTATSEGLDQLSQLAIDLQNQVKAEEDIQKLKTTLTTIAALFLNGLSTHEFVHSGLPSSLFQLLAVDDSNAKLPRSQRVNLFLQTFGPSTRSQLTKSKEFSFKDNAGLNDTFGKNVTSPLLQLVRELQNAIEKNESFPVKLNPLVVSGGLRPNFIADFLTKPFQAKIEKAETEKTLPVIPEGPINVEPLTTGKTLKDFIWAKLNKAFEQEAQASSKAIKAASTQTSSKKEIPSTNTSSSSTSGTTTAVSSTRISSSGTIPTATESAANTTATFSGFAIPPPADSPDQSYDEGDGAEYDDDQLHADEELEQDANYVQDVADNAKPADFAIAVEDTKNKLSARKLKVFLNGIEYNDDVSIFKCIKEHAESRPNASSSDSANSELGTPLPPLWTSTYTIRYMLNAEDSVNSARPASKPPVDEDNSSIERAKRSDFTNLALEECVDQIVNGQFAKHVNFDKTMIQLLSLIKVLHTLNANLQQMAPVALCENILPIPQSEFVNTKLTAKFSRQLQDPLALCTDTLPTWCLVLASELLFLFPLDLRNLYFRGSSLGVPRALMALKDRVDGILEGNFGRIPPHKVRVSRDSIRHLQAAFAVLQRVRHDSRNMLEVEYQNEVATGSGPTLEFYTLVSHAFQQAHLEVWVPGSKIKKIKTSSSLTVQESSFSTAPSNSQVQSKENKLHSMDIDVVTVQKEDDNVLQLIDNPGGLFPSPILNYDPNNSEHEKKCELFSFLGTFIAKAIMDDKMVDLPLSIPLLKGLVGLPIHINDLVQVYPALVPIIQSFIEIVNEKKKIEADSKLSATDKKSKIDSLKYKGGSISDMWLNFDLPGTNIELVEGGSEKALTIDNLDEYVSLIVDAILGKGIQAQLEAMRAGFNHIVNIDRLDMFMLEELETLLCGSVDQDWSRDAILEAAAYTHGFSVNSRVSGWFATVLSEFNEEQRRKFLRFATGSPRLPPRGFKGFHQRLTLSRKDPDKFHKADDYYPSVSTCFLFIKIPDYSSFDVFKERFLTAIENGQQGFGLS